MPIGPTMLTRAVYGVELEFIFVVHFSLLDCAVVTCFISHVSTSETEIILFQPLKEF